MMKAGATQTVGPYQITLNSLADRAGPNYRETVGAMTIRKDGVVVATVEPARRLFATRQMATTQAGIVTLRLGQVYTAIGDPNDQGAVAARLYWKPLVTLIWLGACRDGARRRAVARRPSAAVRRAGAGAFGRRRGARERAEAMARLRALLAFGFLLIAAAAGAVQPDEMMKDPALEARARTLVGRAALPRLPEPVDRRFRRAARRRHPPC